MFIAFLQPEIQSAIDQSLPTPTHQRKVLGTNESVRGFFQFLDMFYQEALPKFWLLSHVDSLLTIRDRHWRKVAATFENRISKFASICGAFSYHVGAYFCMGAYECDVVVVIKMGAYIYGVPLLCGCMLIPIIQC